MDMQFTLAETPDHDALEKGRLLFAGNTDFLKGVVAMSGLPDSDRIEVCFAGRSNVGKSSLINALTGRKALARTSNTPGRTQEINFFTMGEDHYLVDVPGYGYANAPLPVVEKWQRLLKAYLSGRPSLRRVFLLIDARHGPKKVDVEIMEMLSKSAVTFQVVMTKCDKLKSDDLAKVTERTITEIRKYPAAYPELVQTSSAKGEGLETLRAIVAGIV
ncbi:ribosome biogenesis GTP-binding protein YihA/YsxC [Roseobacter sp. N2S]|uniref:ribosome biogenesis GTP-binding protein YihA/YsxC n=1 Tax=Roseobacter sp. N2S TaxID=2663844 RepID=UPI0028660559|nr:ribosome biogenesis GTP-binding protein YihA/YsxC [Roseobacter sp. N2S]MDR6263650.1 GTP-binding protein [Roseobacter sp. N2S]